MAISHAYLEHIKDFIYGATRYPPALIKPSVYWGHFKDDENGNYQRVFFNELISNNFRRTPWQLVFPQQTAGLIKKFPRNEEGVNEYHVRFYSDGVIDCEQEVGRFEKGHWSGPRFHSTNPLEKILNNEMLSLPQNTKDHIKSLFGTKPYSTQCIRKRKQEK